MFLKRLEISGFKSFASKTTLDFLLSVKKGKDRGITAVVGPNGSGKSNIADAMRWVMGEQSMKSLRGKKTGDVIFAGSGKKARLGSADVAVFLDNSDGKLGLDFQEVCIRRKIFRSGESEYLINDSRVRLQDITDALAKAGLGKESYAIVNQGMADSILNATPLERKTLIEDAAGVKQYQIKKERSLRKLQTTRQNLDRTEELLLEIAPHLRALKRQAQRASQRESVEKELREKQMALFSYQWKKFQAEKGELEGDKNEKGREMMNCQRRVDKLSDEIGSQSKDEKESEEQERLEKVRREIKEKLVSLERERVVNEGKIEIEREKEKNSRIFQEMITKSIPVNLSYVKKNIEKVRKDQERLIERIEKVESLEELQDIKEFARAIQQNLFELKSDIEEGKKEEKKKIFPIPSADNSNSKSSEEIAKLQEKIILSKKEMEKTQKSLLEIESKIQKEEERIKRVRSKFFEIQNKFREEQFRLGKLKDQFNEMKISLAKIEVREEDLIAQIKAELKINPENLPDPKRKIDCNVLEGEILKLKAKMNQIGGIDPLVIEEYKETNERFEFLKKESEDLKKAIVSLKEIVNEMNLKIEGEFEKTFRSINEEFGKYFKIIFGGGRARLEKIKIASAKRKKEVIEENEDGDMEAEEEVSGRKKEGTEIGIDILACPPGKRISHLGMLSGGERSLTSLALLFSVISYNPPPFAILDEVEAALDEANSKRFARIIQELSHQTQFVVITHNRQTMRQASVLYGVTMGEDGISKLLSVKLDQVGVGGNIKA